MQKKIIYVIKCIRNGRIINWVYSCLCWFTLTLAYKICKVVPNILPNSKSRSMTLPKLLQDLAGLSISTAAIFPASACRFGLLPPRPRPLKTSDITKSFLSQKFQFCKSFAREREEQTQNQKPSSWNKYEQNSAERNLPKLFNFKLWKISNRKREGRQTLQDSKWQF